MNSTELALKWSELLENRSTRGYKSLRISPECICDLFIGVNSDGRRCLILSLPQGFVLDFNEIQIQNLTIKYFRDTNYIVLQLNDPRFHDLFDDLVLSMYHGIRNIQEAEEYSKYFIQAFHRWSEFFEDKISDILSEEAIKGMIGELLVLKSLINDSNSAEINTILNSWKGPYGKGNDFELETKHLEVKAKTPSAVDVKIASEFQLETTAGKGLELIVISLSSDFNTGITIEQLLIEIRELVHGKLGDMSILIRAISQEGLTFGNLAQYNIYRFKPVKQISYDCNVVGFPKISRSGIPVEICSVSFNLRVSLLTQFINSQNDF
jgi:hypothetical protein